MTSKRDYKAVDIPVHSKAASAPMARSLDSRTLSLFKLLFVVAAGTAAVGFIAYATVSVFNVGKAGPAGPAGPTGSLSTLTSLSLNSSDTLSVLAAAANATADITALRTRITSAESLVASSSPLVTTVSTATANIAQLTTTVGTHTTTLTGIATTDITQTNSIDELNTLTASLSASDASQSTEIAGILATDSYQNATISSLSSTVTSNSASIGGLGTSVTANTAAISANSATIQAVNATAIANSAKIAQNTAGISTNTAAISANTAQIATLAPLSSPVFTNAQVNGSLAVDAIRSISGTMHIADSTDTTAVYLGVGPNINKMYYGTGTGATDHWLGGALDRVYISGSLIVLNSSTTVQETTVVSANKTLQLNNGGLPGTSGGAGIDIADSAPVYIHQGSSLATWEMKSRDGPLIVLNQNLNSGSAVTFGSVTTTGGTASGSLSVTNAASVGSLTVSGSATAAALSVTNAITPGSLQFSGANQSPLSNYEVYTHSCSWQNLIGAGTTTDMVTRYPATSQITVTRNGNLVTMFFPTALFTVDGTRVAGVQCVNPGTATGVNSPNPLPARFTMASSATSAYLPAVVRSGGNYVYGNVWFQQATNMLIKLYAGPGDGDGAGSVGFSASGAFTGWHAFTVTYSLV